MFVKWEHLLPAPHVSLWSKLHQSNTSGLMPHPSLTLLLLIGGDIQCSFFGLVELSHQGATVHSFAFPQTSSLDQGVRVSNLL